MAPDIGADDMAPDIGADDIALDICALDMGALDMGALDIGAAAAEDIGAAAELMAEELVELGAAAVVVLLDPQATRARANPPAAARTARRLMIMELLLLAE
jgi:hypothetical protein